MQMIKMQLYLRFSRSDVLFLTNMAHFSILLLLVALVNSGDGVYSSFSINNEVIPSLSVIAFLSRKEGRSHRRRSHPG